MIRFLFRVMALVALSVAVIMAVLDTTRTIAASELVLTPLATSWQAASPDTLAATQDWMTRTLHPLLWDPVATFVLAQPGFAVIGALAFLLFVLGRRRERRIGRFAET